MIAAIIVEDDPMVTQINRRYLEDFPEITLVGSFGNGNDALAYLKSHVVDLMILDIYMPLRSGMELLREVRRLSIPTDAILVTAANDTRHVDELLRLGIVDYLVKPFEYARFRGAVEKYLKKANILSSHTTLNQNAIDRMVSVPPVGDGGELKKGLQQATLSAIVSYLQSAPQQYHSCEQLAAGVGLSKVTVRRYLNHLMEANVVTSRIDYETGGRPSVMYCYHGA